MKTSEAAQTAASRSRDETKDDPTLWEVDEALWARIARW